MASKGRLQYEQVAPRPSPDIGILRRLILRAILFLITPAPQIPRSGSSRSKSVPDGGGPGNTGRYGMIACRDTITVCPGHTVMSPGSPVYPTTAGVRPVQIG